MSNSTKTSTIAEFQRSFKNTGPMSTIIISETSQSRQTVPLISPATGPKGQPRRNLGMLTITQYHSTYIAHHGNMEGEDERDRAEVETVNEYDTDDFYSPQDRDIYYDENAITPQSGAQSDEYANLPPVPTYTESQMAYHPHGVKRLPHFHPQKFSRRLRTLMDQRRKPRPLYLDIEPQPKLLANSPGPLSTQEQPESILRTLLKMVHSGPDYRQVNQDENRVEAGYHNSSEANYWRGIDHRVIIIGLIGLLLLGLSIGAWTMAVIRAQ